jgi:hypothetical protein
MQVSRNLLVARIKKCFPFNQLDETMIHRLIEQSEVLFFENGQMIFQVGTTGGHLYLILEGKVSILQETRGFPHVINQKMDGGVFGEEVLLPNKKRLATIKAETNLMVLKIPAVYLTNFLDQNPEIAKPLEILVSSYLNLIKNRAVQPLTESIYFFGRPHIFLYIKRLIIPLFLSAIFILAFIFLSSNNGYSIASRIVLAAGSMMVLTSILFWQYLEWRRNTMIVTSKRVISNDVRLLRSEAVMDTPLSTVMNIQLIRTLAGKILDFGDLSIDTYTGGNRIPAVPKADQVLGLIEFLLSSARAESQAKERESFKEILERQQGGSDFGHGEKSGNNTNENSVHSGDFLSQPAIIYRTHWVILLKKVLLPTLLFAMVTLTSAFSYLNSLIPAGSTVLNSLIFILLSASVIGWIYQFFDWYYDRFQIVNNQIIDINQKPFGSEERRSASIFNIQSIRFERKGFLGILLNYGTVFIRIGDEEFTFDKVPNPAGVQARIFRSLESSVSGKQKSELNAQQARLANWLDAYQEFQKSRDNRAE